MSYVAIPPAYYADMRPGTAYHPGGKGWLHAWIDGWGENPNVAWPSSQAAHGVGDAAPAPSGPKPPFSYIGEHPFAAYFRPSNAPWGRFPQGPAYAIPRPNLCPNCVGGNPIAPGVGALGNDCGECEINGGDRCTPCPDGVNVADFPECASCSGGVRQTPWYESELAGQVAVGVLSTLGAGLVLALLHHESKKARV